MTFYANNSGAKRAQTGLPRSSDSLGKITEICHSLLDLRLDDLVLLGAAVLVVLGAATEYVLALVRGRAVEAGVPLAHGILVPGAVLAAQNWNGRGRILLIVIM